MASKLDVAIRILVEGARNLQNVDRDMQKVGASADSVKGRLKSAFSPTNLAIGGITAAIGIVTTGLAVAAKELLENERLNAQTAAAIKSTGGAARVSAKHIEDFAEGLEASTTIERQTVQAAQNMLLTFTKIRNETGKGNDVFDQATEAALNMSVALGTDATSAALQLGKALNDPIAGLVGLNRAGVQFTTEQKAMIRALVEAGDVLGAQRIILAELETQFGGSAEAFANTTSGKIQRFTNDMGNAFEAVILGTLEVTDSFNELGVATRRDFAAIGDVLSTEVVSWGGITDAVSGIVGDVDKELSGMPSSAQVNALAAVRAVEDEYQKGGPVISKEAGKIAGMLPSEIRAKVADIRAAGRENVVQFAAGLQDAQNDPQTAIDAMLLAQETALTRGAEITRLKGQLHSAELAAGLADGRDAVSLAAQAAVTEITDRLTALGAEGFSSGASVMYNLKAGIDYAKSSAVEAMRNAGYEVRSVFPFSEPKDPQSPFRGITHWGENIIETVADGIRSSSGQLSSAFGSISGLEVGSDVRSAASASQSAGGAFSMGGSVTNLTIVLENHGDPILDEKDIVETLQLLTPFITSQKAAMSRG